MNTISKISSLKWLKLAIISVMGLTMFFAVSITAFAVDGVIEDILLQDDIGGDGKIDTVLVIVEYVNPTACDGIMGADTSKWSVKDATTSGMVSVTSITWDSGNEVAGLCAFNLNLNTADTDLSVNTSATALDIQHEAGDTLKVEHGADLDQVTVATVTYAANTEVDAASVVFKSATTGDNNGDGTTDRLAIVFSEPTDIADVNAGDGVTGLSISGDSCSITNGTYAIDNATSVTLTLSGCTAGNTSTVVVPTYDADAGDAIFGDGNDNDGLDLVPETEEMPDAETVAGTDGVSAIIVSPLRVTKDTNSADGSAGTANGTMDGILVTFSEAMDADSVIASDFAITLANGTGLTEAYSDTTDDTTLFFKCSDCTAGDTSNLLKLQITGVITDANGVVFTAEGSPVAASDGAAPWLMTKTYTDNGTNGSVDRLVLVFSESVTWNGSDLTQFEAVAQGLTGFVGNPSAIASGSGTATLTLTMPATTNLTGVSGGTEPTIAYTQSGTADNRVKDTASLDLATFTAVSITDGAGAIITARLTKDTNSVDGSAGTANGTMDGILATFSEAMDVSSALAADFAITTSTDGELTEAYSDVTDNTTLFFGCSNCTAGNTSDLLKLQITGEILDLAAVGVAAVTEGSSVSASDGAAPWLTTKEYLDNGTDGTVDRLRLTFTETLVTATSKADDFGWTPGSLTGTTLTGDGVGAISTNTLTFTLSGTTTNNTGGPSAPTVLFSGSAGGRKIADSASNEVASWTAATVTDAAAPVLVSIATNTASGANMMVMTYSEPMTYNTDGWYTNTDGTKASDDAFGEMMTATVIDGIGNWTAGPGVTGNMANNAVTDNSISLNSAGVATADTVLTIIFNAQAGGYFTSASTTAPTATNTFVIESDINVLKDQGAGLAVAATLTALASAPTITPDTGTWDVTKPTITSITYAEGTGLVNGSIDKATIVFNSTMLGASLADNNCTVAGGAGTFSESANGATKIFNRTADTATTGTAVADGTFLCTDNSPKIRDLAGNLLSSTTIDGTMLAADRTGKETDGANPVLMTAAISNNDVSYKNVFTLTYSEALTVKTDNDTTIAAGASGASSATMGAMTTAKTLAGLITLTNGDADLVCNAATSNTVALDATAKIVTVTINAQTGGFFVSGTLPPDYEADVDAMTVTSASTRLYDAASLGAVAKATPATLTETSAWDVEKPSQITGFHYEAMVGAGQGRIEWTAHSTLTDWSRYMFAYGTSASVGLTSSLWTSSNDANLTTIGTNGTVITGLTEGNTYYTKAYAIDAAGNVGTGSSEQSFILQGSSSSGGSSSDSGGGGGGGGSSRTTTTTTTTTPATTATTTPATDTTTSTETDTATTVTTETATEGGESSEIVPITIETKSGETVTLTDIPSEHWAVDMVEAMVKAEVINGNPDGTFKPEASLNRAETAKLLFKIMGLEDPANPTLKPFTDVEIDQWYAGYVAELKTREIANGNPDGTYKPASSINRAEFLKMAMSLYKYLADETTKAELEALEAGEQTTAYADLDTSAWYSSAVTAATEKGFIGGKTCTEGKCFDANANITRAEATKILYNMFGKMLEVTE
ncbi:MAG: S-layer homology domain-containing protein [Candidatus Gracilibacteria bacterium]|jgi:hypothetical protein